jgi:hypothetical protein
MINIIDNIYVLSSIIIKYENLIKHFKNKFIRLNFYIFKESACPK